MLILLEVDISFFSFLYKKKDQSLLICVFTTPEQPMHCLLGTYCSVCIPCHEICTKCFQDTSAFLFRHAKKKFPAAVITLY